MSLYPRKKIQYKKKKPSLPKQIKSKKPYNKYIEQVHYFKVHTSAFSPLTIDNISKKYEAYNFSLADLTNAATYASLFDSYKILGVEFCFMPQQTANISLGDINNAWGNTRFFSAIDYTDSGSVTSIGEIQEYNTCIATPALQVHKRFIVPKINDSSSAYNVPGSPWLNTSSTSTNYFGLKIAVDEMQSSTTTTMDYTVECTYWMCFKNAK